MQYEKGYNVYCKSMYVVCKYNVEWVLFRNLKEFI